MRHPLSYTTYGRGPLGAGAPFMAATKISVGTPGQDNRVFLGPSRTRAIPDLFFANDIPRKLAVSMGRASKRTPKIEEAILDGITNGVPLAVLCRRPGMPSDEAWRNWCRADERLAQAYAMARTMGADAIVIEMMGIADRGGDSIPSQRMRINELLKLLARWNPRP